MQTYVSCQRPQDGFLNSSSLMRRAARNYSIWDRTRDSVLDGFPQMLWRFQYVPVIGMKAVNICSLSLCDSDPQGLDSMPVHRVKT